MTTKTFETLPADIKGTFRVLDADGSIHELSNVNGISHRFLPAPGFEVDQWDGVLRPVSTVNLSEWTVGGSGVVTMANATYGDGPTQIRSGVIVSIELAEE